LEPRALKLSALVRRCKAMPFEAYSAYFQPEELGILAAAYDAA
jgi:hypothetical protein